jgi:DNA-binding IclR family transcriptional regulator
MSTPSPAAKAQHRNSVEGRPTIRRGTPGTPARQQLAVDDPFDGVADEAPVAGAQVVDRVVDILEALAQARAELGVSDVSRLLGLKKATAHRLLVALRRRGLVSQDSLSRRYRLGLKLWELGMRATSHVDWVDRAKPYLERLTHETGETSHLAVLSDGQVLYVEKVESPRSLRIPSQVGRRLPVHCTAVGKALVAFLPDDVLKAIVLHHGLQRFTKNTITDLDRLREELAVARVRGYTTDNEEIEEGLACIGAPVRDHSAHVVAAISIAGPATRVRGERMSDHVRAVLAAAAGISRLLGCPPELLRANASADEPLVPAGHRR